MPDTEVRAPLRETLTDAVAALTERAMNSLNPHDAATYAKAAADLVHAASSLVMSGLER